MFRHVASPLDVSFCYWFHDLPNRGYNVEVRKAIDSLYKMTFDVLVDCASGIVGRVDILVQRN